MDINIFSVIRISQIRPLCKLDNRNASNRKLLASSHGSEVVKEFTALPDRGQFCGAHSSLGLGSVSRRLPRLRALCHVANLRLTRKLPLITAQTLESGC